MKSALLVMTGVSAALFAAVVAIGCAVSSGWGDLLPSAEAQDAPVAAQNGKTLLIATGGTDQNMNDVLWVVSKYKPIGRPERIVVVSYKLTRDGDFELKDTRWVDPDLRVPELAVDAANPVRNVLRAMPKEEREALQGKDEEREK